MPVDLAVEQFETPVPCRIGAPDPFQATGPSARAREVVRRAFAADPGLPAGER